MPKVILDKKDYDQIEQRLKNGEALKAIAVNYNINLWTLRNRLKSQGRQYAKSYFILTSLEKEALNLTYSDNFLEAKLATNVKLNTLNNRILRATKKLKDKKLGPRQKIFFNSERLAP